MCCITHNKLVLGVTFLSIALGIFIIITSSYVIHYKEDLESQTTHFSHLLACAVFTLITGTLQTISSLFFLTRRITTQRWININAVVFLIIILGICIAMSHFQMTPPPSSNSTSNSTPVHLNLLMAEYDNSTVVVAGDDAPNILDNSTMPAGAYTKNKNATDFVTEDSGEASMEDPDSREDVKPSEPDVLMDPGPKHSLDSEENEESEDTNITKLLIILRFYFTSLLSNCLSLPIFLGLVASKASKYEVRGKNLLDDS